MAQPPRRHSPPAAARRHPALWRASPPFGGPTGFPRRADLKNAHGVTAADRRSHRRNRFEPGYATCHHPPPRTRLHLRYAHLSRFTVRAGQNVAREVIGAVGSTDLHRASTSWCSRTASCAIRGSAGAVEGDKMLKQRNAAPPAAWTPSSEANGDEEAWPPAAHRGCIQAVVGDASLVIGETELVANVGGKNIILSGRCAAPRRRRPQRSPPPDALRRPDNACAGDRRGRAVAETAYRRRRAGAVKPAAAGARSGEAAPSTR